MAQAPTEHKQGVEALDRAIKLLQCFTVRGEALTLAALAQRSGFYKSTILRLAVSLSRAGFISRMADGRYVLGPELRRLGGLTQPAVSLESVIRPALHALRATTGETASFYIRAGEDRLCLYRENSEQSVRHHLDEGTRHPLSSGAAGLVLTLFGCADGSDASQELERTGAIISRGRRDPNLAAVATPVTDRQGHLLGALAVSGLSSRLSQKRLEEARRHVIAAARTIAQSLPADEEAFAPDR